MVEEPDEPPHFCCLASDREFEDMREQLDRIERTNMRNSLTNNSTANTSASKCGRPRKGPRKGKS